MIVTRGELYDFFFFFSTVLWCVDTVVRRTRPRLYVITDEFPGQAPVIGLIPGKLQSFKEINLRNNFLIREERREIS